MTKTEVKIKKELSNLGFSDEEAGRMYRLITESPTTDEKKRWIECRVVDGESGKIIVEEGAEESFGIQLCLFNMAYNGLITRTQRGTSMQISKDNTSPMTPPHNTPQGTAGSEQHSRQPQQEYTIDNEMLLQWRTGCFRANATFNPDGVCAGCKFDNKKRGGCDFDDDDMQKIFQSRPHTSPPAPERKVICTDSSVSESNPCNDNCMRCTEARVITAKEIPGLPECNGCETGVCCEACHVWIKSHNAQIAKAAREQVLGLLIARIEKELLTNTIHLYDSKSAYLSVLAWSRGLKAGGTL